MLLHPIFTPKMVLQRVQQVVSQEKNIGKIEQIIN